MSSSFQAGQQYAYVAVLEELDRMRKTFAHMDLVDMALMAAQSRITDMALAVTA